MFQIWKVIPNFIHKMSGHHTPTLAKLALHSKCVH